MQLVVLVMPEMRAFEVTGTLEVFSGDPVSPAIPRERIRVVSPNGGEVELGHGFKIATEPFRSLAPSETLIVPGFDRIDGVLESLDSGALDPMLELIGNGYRAGAQIVSLCTGIFVVAATGVLTGVHATTHWSMVDLVHERHPDLELDADVLYTHDRKRRIWTSAGVTAGVDLCLALLAAEYGAAAAADSARGMVLPAVRHGVESQPINSRRGDRERPWKNELGEVQSAVRNNLARSWTTQDLAHIAHFSPRTLQLRFLEDCGMSPLEWVILERVTAARELLESTSASVEGIAHDVGFGSSDLLRRHFVRHIGTTPGKYREYFRLRLNTAPTRPGHFARPALGGTKVG